MERLAPELVSRIAFLMLIDDDSSLSPPSVLLPLTRVCRSINHSLSFNRNSSLLSEAFRLGFDTSALSRRFPVGALSAVHLAGELKKRYRTLKRIKDGSMNESTLLDDLWVAYLMMLENDGLNAKQLGRAGFSSFLLNCLQIHARQGGLLQDPERISLAVWLVWLTSTHGMSFFACHSNEANILFEESLRSESTGERDTVFSVLKPLVIAGCRVS